MQAGCKLRPSVKAETSLGQRKIPTRFIRWGQHFCSFPVSGTRLGHRGKGWEGSETSRLRSFLIRNRN